MAVALHLTNTLLLTGASALTVAFAQAPLRASIGAAARGRAGSLLSALLVGLVLVAASGAVTALGDTLFPVHGLAGVAPPDHFLVELRVLHPIMACFMVCACVLVGSRFARLPRPPRRGVAARFPPVRPRRPRSRHRQGA